MASNQILPSIILRQKYMKVCEENKEYPCITVIAHLGSVGLQAQLSLEKCKKSIQFAFTIRHPAQNSIFTTTYK